MPVTLTANRELPIPVEVCAQLGLQVGEEFDLLVERDRLVAVRKNVPPREEFRSLMARLGYVEAGRRFDRDEANER